MHRIITFAFLLVILLAAACNKKSVPAATERDLSSPSTSEADLSPAWKNATVYFLLTDRFNNGNPANDQSFSRKSDGAPLRSFMGGDLRGITQKIEEGYFDSLGVNAIWMTPVYEQIRGSVDEGTGKTYAFHGYWIRDWTALDPNFGTREDFKNMVEAAHRRDIRILMDVVLNHTGPVTPIDSQWPDSWVRTGPRCTYQGYRTTTACTLVDNLPDIRTENKESAVELPPFLVEKWRSEGRLQEETRELDAFFKRTGYPRAPRYYIIKWLTDWVREYGIDGYRVDTAKHLEEDAWSELKKEAELAFAEWQRRNEGTKPEDTDFFMVGEVYGYGIGGGRDYNFGDRVVDYYDHGFEALINFDFKNDARKEWEQLFAPYAQTLNADPFEGRTVLNYLASHDDGSPYDADRQRALDAGTKLLLAPGAAQIYYGDETARDLQAAAEGDAKLRSFMNWKELDDNKKVQNVGTREVLRHWRRLGQFRRDHPAIGAGTHERLAQTPYTFRRTYQNGRVNDQVVVALDAPNGGKTITVGNTFQPGARLRDHYSGTTVTVGADNTVKLDTPYSIVLLAGVEE